MLYNLVKKINNSLNHDMPITTKPTWVEYAAITAIFAMVGIVAWVPILFLLALVLDIPGRVYGSILLTLITLLLLIPKAKNWVKHCRWSIDFSGLTSKTIGRIEFDKVVSLFIGFPDKASVPMYVLENYGGSISQVFQGTLVLRLTNGDLVPINLHSPTIANGAQVMDKLFEILAGKIHPNDEYTAVEKKALKSRPLNRIIKVKAA